VVAEAPDAFELYPLKGALFADAAGFLANLGEGPLRQSPGAMKGLEKGASGRILGIFPDGAWLVSGSTTFKWVKDRWGETTLLRERETLLDIAGWGDNRAVAAIAMPGNDMRFFLVGGKSGVVVPSPYPADKPKPAAAPPAESASAAAEAPPPPSEPEPENKPPDDSCKVKMKPDGVVLSGLPTGQLYAAGYECQEIGHGAAIAERWEPKKLRGTAEPLPRPEGEGSTEIRGVLARSPTEVLVFGKVGAPGRPYLARFDGKAWSLEKAPFTDGITSIVAADENTLWAIAGGLWKKAGAAEWTKVELPASLTPKSVAARTATEVWVSATNQKGEGVLLRSTPAAAKDLVKLPTRKAMSDMVSSNRRWIATPACDKVYAHLATLGPSKSEPPKDFSVLKAALASNKEFESLAPIVEDDGAHLYIGVPVPSIEVGQKLLAAYAEKSPKTVSNLFCHEPVIIKQAIRFQ
jgi:hypothetical protein